MQKVAPQILIASVVFYVMMIGFEVLVRGAALNGETLISAAFITVIFAMAYAAFHVAKIIFRGEDK